MMVNKRQEKVASQLPPPPQMWTEDLHWLNGSVRCVTGNEACDHTAAAAPNLPPWGTRARFSGSLMGSGRGYNAKMCVCYNERATKQRKPATTGANSCWNVFSWPWERRLLHNDTTSVNQFKKWLYTKPSAALFLLFLATQVSTRGH